MRGYLSMRRYDALTSAYYHPRMEEFPLFAISIGLRHLWRRECAELLEHPRGVVRKLEPQLYLVCLDAEAERIAAIYVRRMGELEGPP